MALILIYEVFDREAGYEGGGRGRETWRRQKAAKKQLSYMFEGILAAVRARRRKPGRCGKGGGWEKVA